MELWIFAAVAAAACVVWIGAFLIDRGLLWMEEQGWIHYRRTRLNFQGGRQAMVRLGAFLEPAKEHVVELEERLKVERQDDDQGGSRGKTRPLYDSVREEDGRR